MAGGKFSAFESGMRFLVLIWCVLFQHCKTDPAEIKEMMKAEGRYLMMCGLCDGRH